MFTTTKPILWISIVCIMFFCALTSCRTEAREPVDPAPVVEQPEALDFTDIFYDRVAEVSEADPKRPFEIAMIQPNIDSLYAALGGFPGPTLECRRYTLWQPIKAFGLTMSAQQVCDHTYRIAVVADTVLVWFYPNGTGASMLNEAKFETLNGFSTCDKITEAILSDSTSLHQGITLDEDASALVIASLEHAQKRSDEEIRLCSGEFPYEKVRDDVYTLNFSSDTLDPYLYYLMILPGPHVLIADQAFYDTVSK